MTMIVMFFLFFFSFLFFVFFFNDTATTEIYTLSLHDALPILEDFHGYDGDKRTLLNNCIEPRLGLHILNCATKRGVSELKLGKAQSLNKDLKVQSPTSPKLPSATSPNPNIQSKKNKFEILPPSREKLL